jgi:hypothetical protein
LWKFTRNNKEIIADSAENALACHFLPFCIRVLLLIQEFKHEKII